MCDDIINLELNEEGVYDVTDDTNNSEDVKEVEDNNYQCRAPINEFVDGIFMGLNVSDFINKTIRRVI